MLLSRQLRRALAKPQSRAQSRPFHVLRKWQLEEHAKLQRRLTEWRSTDLDFEQKKNGAKELATALQWHHIVEERHHFSLLVKLHVQYGESVQKISAAHYQLDVLLQHLNYAELTEGQWHNVAQDVDARARVSFAEEEQFLATVKELLTEEKSAETIKSMTDLLVALDMQKSPLIADDPPSIAQRNGQHRPIKL